MINYFQYSLAMTGPPTTGGQPWRHGVLLQAKVNGHQYYGDLCPLPGLHQHSLNEYLHQIQSLDPADHEALAGWLCQPAMELPEALKSLIGGLPALSFALHTLRAAIHGYSPRVWPFNKPPEKREIAGLLDSSQAPGQPNLLDTGPDRLADLGGTWKIKIGRADYSAEHTFITSLISKFADAHPSDAGALRLRLDANQSMNRNSISRWIDLLEEPMVVYLEEPFQKLDDYLWFAQEYPHLKNRIAFDESLAAPFFQEIKGVYSGAYVIVKPSLIEFERACGLLNRYGSQGIVSAAFESGLGLNSLAAMGHAQTAAGIGTWRWFKDDLLLVKAVHGRHWHFQLRPQVDVGRLKRLDL